MQAKAQFLGLGGKGLNKDFQPRKTDLREKVQGISL